MRAPIQKSWIILTAIGLLALAGCGSDSGKEGSEQQGDGAPPVKQGDGGVAPGSDAAKPAGAYGTCCINDAFYLCATKAAFDVCIGFDVMGCHAACGMADFDCHMDCDDKALNAVPDPSQCQRNAARDGECQGTKPTPGTCETDPLAEKCTLDSQCFFKNCTKGYCQGNGEGNPCTLDSHCMTKNCTKGCCSGNGSGSPCTLDSHCWSKNCTGGECQ